MRWLLVAVLLVSCPAAVLGAAHLGMTIWSVIGGERSVQDTFLYTNNFLYLGWLLVPFWLAALAATVRIWTGETKRGPITVIACGGLMLALLLLSAPFSFFAYVIWAWGRS